MNFYFIRKFNHDLQKLSNNQILNNITNLKKENRILDFNDFKIKYPEFKLEFYKSFHLDIGKLDNISLLHHYHIYGKNEKRIYNLDSYLNYNDKFKINDFKNTYFRIINYFVNNLKNYNKIILLLKINIYFCKKQKLSYYGNLNNYEIQIFDKLFYDFNINFFDYNFYIRKYKDLEKIKEKKKLFIHWLNHGFFEDRICSVKYENEVKFNYEFYKNNYPDLEQLNSNELLNHYINHGKKENRLSNIKYDFSTKNYITICDLNYFVINRKKNTLRKKDMLDKLGKTNIINFEFFDAIDNSFDIVNQRHTKYITDFNNNKIKTTTYWGEKKKLLENIGSIGLIFSTIELY